jgi:hypothetical protein
MQSGIRGGVGLLKNLIQRAGGPREASELLKAVRQVLPGAESAPVRRAAVQAGENLGILGTRNIPTSSQLGQAPAPQWMGANTRVPFADSPNVNTFAPQPSPVARTRFTEDLISQPTLQGPARAPMQGPSMTGNPVQGELDLRFPAGSRAVAEFTTARGAVRPEGTPIGGQFYRGGPVATERNLETIRLSQAQPGAARNAAVPEGQQSIFTSRLPDIFSGEYTIRPELLRGSSPVDAAAAAAARNAASGAELVDLGALFNNPAFRAAAGAAGLGMFGAGMAGMMSGDRTGETTAGSPPSLPLTQTPTPFLFGETDGSPLGVADSSAMEASRALGNIDPSVAGPTVTTGNLQRESAIREALAQSAPGAAAVRRAVEPMSPERYRSIEDYAAARQAYAQAKPEIQQLMKYMEGQSPTIGGGLAMWASANPVLAYRFQERQLANPAANQQSAESITTTTVTSPIGSQIDAAAVGNARATADAAVNPNQGAFDMVGVTSPQVQPNLQRVLDFINRQAPRPGMSAGY